MLLGIGRVKSIMGEAGMQIEYRTATGPALTADVARHLQGRLDAGRAIIMTARPIAFLSSLRKHWLRHSRSLQRERAATLDPIKIASLLQKLADMHNTTFSAADDGQLADVWIIAPSDTSAIPYGTATLYICAYSNNEQFVLASSRLATDGLMVDYIGMFEHEAQM